MGCLREWTCYEIKNEVVPQASAAPISRTDLRCALTGPNTQPGGVQDGLSKRLYQPFTSSFTRRPVANEMPSRGTTATACTLAQQLRGCFMQREPPRTNASRQRTTDSPAPILKCLNGRLVGRLSVLSCFGWNEACEVHYLCSVFHSLLSTQLEVLLGTLENGLCGPDVTAEGHMYTSYKRFLPKKTICTSDKPMHMPCTRPS